MGTGGVLWVCLVLGLVWGDEGPIERIVQSPQGPVRGYKQPGDNIYLFYGVPYATAPTGRDKYKAPLPPPAWGNVFDAVERIICPQYSPAGEVKENCLVANVYVPDTEDQNLPVVVYVHGGAYHLGGGSLIEAKNLVRGQKVLKVSFNYRLGIHGFLCLGTEHAPGNAGMKDMVALLRWVNRNIASYGGNPDDVTIAGYSAGSSAVDLLMLSPSTRGLFHKVIPESGSNLAAWSVQVDPVENARWHAKSVGFEKVDDINALEEFYLSASVDDITSTSFRDRSDTTFVFSPCVERGNDQEAFLTDSPYNLLKSGDYPKVPMLYGFADMEGLFRVDHFDSWKDRMNANFSEFLPIDLQFANEQERDEVSEAVKEFYFGDRPVSEDNILSYIDFMSDTYFVHAHWRSIQLHIEGGHDKLYLYEYNFVDESSPAVPHTDDVKGATHCAQTVAIFDGRDWLSQDFQDEQNISEPYKKIKSIMREIWTNFISTGAPVPPGSSLPAWPAASGEWAPHMSLGRRVVLRREMSLHGAPVEPRMRFWDAIYARHYRAPQPPAWTLDP